MPSPEEVVFSTSLTGLDRPDSPRGRQLHTTKDKDAAPGPLHRRSTRSLSTRRSVSGMRGLMPLALSPSRSPSSLPASEGMDQKADDYFPEVLARDLESSTDVFTAKNMTAGTPAAVLPAGDKAWRKHKSCPTRPTVPMRNHSASARVQSLGAIQERNVIVSFLDHQQQPRQQAPVDDTTSDLESNTGTENSGGVAPPSFRYRQRSVTTAATSVTGSSCKPSPNNASPPLDGSNGLSWIEIDSDEEEQEVDEEKAAGSASSRPPTPPPKSDPPSPVKPFVMESRPTWNCNNPLHHKSHSFSGGVPIIPPQRHSSKRGTDRALGRVPLRAMEDDCTDFRRVPVYAPHQYHSPPSKIRVLHSQADMGQAEKVPAVVETAALSDVDPGSDDEREDMTDAAWNRPDTVYIRPSPPPSPLPSVQAWLNNSVRPCTPGRPSDDLSKAVPLPPDVIETLRVSIACFPETMLLSSSLTVETIRAYSRKVRHPNPDLRDLPTTTSSQSAKKSVWRRVVSYRRGSGASDQTRPRDTHTSNQSSLPSSASSSSLDNPQPWMPLKHVFGCCSNYICDALYAHILAYNYISALVPRNTTPPKPAQHNGGSQAQQKSDSQKEDIPKKAASVLGLAGAAANSVAPPAPQRVAKKLSMSRLSWGPGKDPGAGQQMSAAQEQTARDIQAGLMRCIVRLVATAKLMVESGTSEERMVEMDAKEVDVLFTRSLCEIVRISEEAC